MYLFSSIDVGVMVLSVVKTGFRCSPTFILIVFVSLYICMKNKHLFSYYMFFAYYMYSLDITCSLHIICKEMFIKNCAKNYGILFENFNRPVFCCFIYVPNSQFRNIMLRC
jgi:hypothetical protein